MKFLSLMKAIGLSPARRISKLQPLRVKSVVGVSVGLTVFLMSAACIKVAGQQNSETASMSRVVDGNVRADDGRYRIGPGDVLSILVRKAPELSVDAVRVDQRGLIRIPMIERAIPAACRTESDLADEIASVYLEYKRNPSVSVYVREFQSRPVAVIGAINGPGQFRLQRRVRLAELLTFAGGPAARAGRIINIIHTSEPDICRANPSDSGTAAVSDTISVFNLHDTLKGKEEANPFVTAGDIISIPDAEQVFVIGHVMQPQAIALRDRPITISRAIAMSGGAARDGTTGRIRIIRETSNHGKQEIVVDLKAVLKQKAEDVVLVANDIVEVPSSTGKTILTSLMGAIAPTLSNVPIRLIP